MLYGEHMKNFRSDRRGYDVRSVANIVLRRAWAHGLKVSNLHLNKTLFFMHVDYLRDFDGPLLSAKIEAWDYGPVFREIYTQFKVFKKTPISKLASRVSKETGELEIADDGIAAEEVDYLNNLADFYLKIPAGVLVDLSHAKGGAWDRVWSSGEVINAGMEITEEIIRDTEVKRSRRIKLL